MSGPSSGDHTASARLIRRTDLVPETVAFIDCKIPGSDRKVNYSVIGAGVSQSAKQTVGLDEPHGFALGVAAMPHGVTNNLHMHYTAEVFMVFRGEWLFRWGAEGDDGELIGRPGDVLSIPTWIFRGFTNLGADDSWIFTALGRDESGGVVWHPRILEVAADHGLYLRRDNTMVDVAAGEAMPSAEDLIQPMSAVSIAAMERYSVEEMRQRLLAAGERAFSPRALLHSVLPGHAAELAPAIGPGMTQDRLARPRITNPHGISIEWLRMTPGQSIGPFRIEPKQVLIVQSGRLEIVLGLEAADGGGDRAIAEPWDTFATPAGVWRTLSSRGNEPMVAAAITAGDAKAMIEWSTEIVQSARAHDLGVDPNGYLAPASLLPPSAQPSPVAA